MNPQDVLPGEADWLALTVVPKKQDAYLEDLYFREVWADLALLVGRDTPRFLQPLALLCAKPDAVVGRRLRPMLDFAIEHGFQVLGTFDLEFSRHSMRELWRFDWHVYPSDRLAFSSVWYCASRTLAFVLRDVRPDRGLPASVRLSRLKGNSIATKRHGAALRSRLSPPNSVLNFVHVPDEPADIVRELGIFLERPQRLRLLRALLEQRGDAREAALTHIGELEQIRPAHDLNAIAALARLRDAAIITAAQAEMVERLIRDGGRLGWDSLCSLVDPQRTDCDRWDFIAIASSLIPLERTHLLGTMPEVELDAWLARVGGGDRGTSA